MRHERPRRAAIPPLFALTVAAAGMSACGSSPITSERIERAIESTFANLVHVQVARLDLPPIAPTALEVTASCRRLAGTAGAGDWICRIRWLAPDGRPLHDTFDLSVTTDGCYTATAEGDSLGGPLLKRRDGTDVRNVLSVFEGCFDAT